MDELFSRADVLLSIGDDQWDIIEVKSATQLKDINIHNLTFQKYIHKKFSLNIRNCVLIHINNQYVKNRNIESSELFVQADIAEKCIEIFKRN